MTTFFSYSYLRENMGGIVSIQYALISDIVSFPSLNPLLFSYNSEIGFAVGKSWSLAMPVAGRAEFSEDSEDSDASHLFNAVLKVVFAKADADSMPYYNNSAPIILKITDSNGVSFLMGDPSRPLTSQFNRQTGVIPADRNQIAISYSCSAPFPCPLYEF